jgi:site-specific recombinase XerD
VSVRTPTYRLHKPTGQAVVTLNGRDFYLGKHGAPESRAQYDQLIAEWLSNGRSIARPGSSSYSDITINEMFEAFETWAEGYYRKGGVVTGEVTNIKYAIRTIRQLYGATIAQEFGPLHLKAVRQAILETGICRNEINRRVRIIVRAFKWAVSEAMIPPSVHHGLQAISGLRRGRSDARETVPVKPVPDAIVDAVRPHLPRQVWAMVELQRLTGMRPGEVTSIRAMDINTAGSIWEYRPDSHKTEHHGKDRVVFLGPQAQRVLKPWLRADLSAFLFQPREADAERRVAKRAARKSPVQPSQRNRRRRRPKKAPGAKYDAGSYRQAIERACDRAFPHPTIAPSRVQDLAVPDRERFRSLQEERRTRGLSKKRRKEIKAQLDAILLPAQRRVELEAWRKAHRWHPNQLRHNAATRLRREFGLDVARAVLGHSSPAVTAIYAEVDQAKAADAMGRIG